MSKPKEPSTPYGVRFNDSERRELDQAAKKTGLSTHALIRSAALTVARLVNTGAVEKWLRDRLREGNTNDTSKKCKICGKKTERLSVCPTCESNAAGMCFDCLVTHLSEHETSNLDRMPVVDMKSGREYRIVKTAIETEKLK